MGLKNYIEIFDLFMFVHDHVMGLTNNLKVLCMNLKFLLEPHLQ